MVNNFSFEILGISRMKTILQSTSKTLQASTSGETCEDDMAHLTCKTSQFTFHVSRETHRYELHTANDQLQNQVERLFPEFFTSCSNTAYVESNTLKTSRNAKHKQTPSDPLIQSWLNLYGGGSND